jgi:hypothetical protein
VGVCLCGCVGVWVCATERVWGVGVCDLISSHSAQQSVSTRTCARRQCHNTAAPATTAPMMQANTMNGTRLRRYMGNRWEDKHAPVSARERDGRVCMWVCTARA